MPFLECWLRIREDLIVRRAPAIIRALLVYVEIIASEIEELRSDVRKLCDEDGSVSTGSGKSGKEERSTHGHAKSRTKSKDKRVNQPGHVKCECPLISVEQCVEVVSVFPDA